MQAFQVDVGRLRGTLDEIRMALATETVRASGLFRNPNLKSVVESIRSVLEAYGRRDTTAQIATESVSEYRDPGHLQRLRDFVDRLNQLNASRLFDLVDEPRRAQLETLVQYRSPDFLSVVNRANDENAHSDMIAWLLNPKTAPVVSVAALRYFFASLPDSQRWIDSLTKSVANATLVVRREYVFGREWAIKDELSRIDILVESPDFTLAIENKVWSLEHANQTQTYWSWLKTLPGLKAGLFLSPLGLKAECESFTSVSYLDLLCALLSAENITEAEKIMLSSYVKSLRASTLKSELRILGGTS
jgi:PD-(D/E)XK nuclease superfamily